LSISVPSGVMPVIMKTAVKKYFVKYLKAANQKI